MDPILKREIMLDNYENNMNRGLVDDDSYIKINTNNESCIDNLDIMYKIEDGKLVDIVEQMVSKSEYIDFLEENGVL